MIGEETLAQVAIKGRGFTEIVGHRQIELPVAVEVAKGDPHAGLEAAVGAGGRARNLTGFLEPQSAPVGEEIVGRHVVGDVKVDLSIIIEMGRHNAQAPAVGIHES